MEGPGYVQTSVCERKLGNTSLSLSELGFGAAPLGNLYREISNSASYEAIEAAWDAGIRYFDTAPYYGLGLSERRLGDILRSNRDQSFVLSTKVGRILVPNRDVRGSEARHGFCSPVPFEPIFNYSYDAIMRSYEDSLQRLGLAKIDILLVHDLGQMTHGSEHEKYFAEFENGGMRALEELKGSGDVKAIGLGVNEFEICEQAMQVGQFDCFLLAGRYTLLEQEALSGFMPKCESHGASIIIGGVYNSGILATGVRSGGDINYNYEPANNAIIDRVGKIEEICQSHGVPLAAAALQFPLHHKLVASVIPGVSSARRVQQTIDLFNINIPEQLWADLKSNGLLDKDAPTS